MIFLMLLPPNPNQETETGETRVLFLDDMEWRHSEFRRLTEGLGIRIDRAHSADEAITLLSSRHYDQVFLDHDLSEEDVMVAPGSRSHVPTGMDVVDHILSMASPPGEAIVHSCNGPAAEEMRARLERCGIRSVRRVPFPQLQRLLFRP